MPKPKNVKVALIVCGRNELLWLKPFFAALQLVKRQDLCCVYVDSASSDGSAEFVEASYPAITLVRLERSRGVAFANNQGLQRALEVSPEYCFFLNPDTLVSEKLFIDLLSAAEAHPEFGLLSPVEMEYPPAELPGPNRWTRQMLWRLGNHEFSQLGIPPRVGDVEACRYTPDIIEPPHVRGAALLVRTEVFRSIGNMDEWFESFADDYEFCRRARRNGIRAGIVLGAQLPHADGGGAQLGPVQASYRQYFTRRNQFLLILSDEKLSMLLRWKAVARLVIHQASAVIRWQQGSPRELARILCAVWKRIPECQRRRRHAKHLGREAFATTLCTRD